MKLLTIVPFSGFYNTMHEDAIDFQDYAKAYVNQISSGLTFDRLESPRFYNCETNRIFAYISLENAVAMLKNVDTNRFNVVCKDKFSSYDGFISFYDSDWANWGSIIDWDHNQLGALLEAYLDEDIEEQVYAHLASNGFVKYGDECHE